MSAPLSHALQSRPPEVTVAEHSGAAGKASLHRFGLQRPSQVHGSSLSSQTRSPTPSAWQPAASAQARSQLHDGTPFALRSTPTSDTRMPESVPGVTADVGGVPDASPRWSPDRAGATLRAMKTRAAVAYAAGKPLVIEEVDLEGPKAGEGLVEIKATGVCDTGALACQGDA